MENEIKLENEAVSVPQNDVKATEQITTEQTPANITAAENKLQSATEKYCYMIPSGIAMYIIPKNLIGKYSYKELTGGNAKDNDEFEDGVKNAVKEPTTEHTATASFNFEELQKFFKVVKTLGAEHITISLKTNSPMKITAENSDGENITYWLAPWVNE